MHIGPYAIVPKVILAPMAGGDGQTVPVCCAGGWAQAGGVGDDHQRPAVLARRNPCAAWTMPARPDPVSVQIAGTVPEGHGRGRVLQRRHGAQLIDINLGCRRRRSAAPGLVLH